MAKVNDSYTKQRKQNVYVKGGERLDGEKIGKRLVELRGGRTQKEVGDAVGVEAMAISYYERGIRIPRDEVKIKLAKYYGVTVESLFYT